MPEEIWKDVVGYEGLYKVSNYGRVMGLYARRRGMLLSVAKTNKGYRYVCLYKDKKSKCIKVHRLVAITFLPNVDNLPEVDHIDGSRDNDVVWNLRWVSHRQNVNNPVTRKRFSDRQLGANNSFYGKHHTAESKAQISETKRAARNLNKK